MPSLSVAEAAQTKGHCPHLPPLPHSIHDPGHVSRKHFPVCGLEHVKKSESPSNHLEKVLLSLSSPSFITKKTLPGLSSMEEAY